ncbi:hypothetical protein HPP92_002122 [Vanilla planifolia]|uniref:Peptidase A1 domain-containing protein n=1 Tax=Vanilla planifolia TaxID=51239 RepID=A0A835RZL2_VANPL|nr:hypothetical protein HPP92_002122 [Vanilla planifolia]
MQATNGTGIMGNLAQHNFHIGYDLVGRKVAFKPTDCSSISEFSPKNSNGTASHRCGLSLIEAWRELDDRHRFRETWLLMILVPTTHR